MRARASSKFSLYPKQTGASYASLRASSPVWSSEASLARTPFPAPRGFAASSRVLARLVSLAQIGELARRLARKANIQS